ncbi:MAG: RluA family pseudouridine synthase [Candidatus Omnitrophica bacterium]|nr:RluA family pseudouridine synthase [Candidatus Omnitrophota bacterium]
MRTHAVTENSALLNYLRKAFPHITRTKTKTLLKSGVIFVNERPITRHDFCLKRGDEIRIQRRPVETHVEFKPRLSFPIVYEDDAIIVIDKPNGLLTMGTDRIKIHTAYYKVTDYVKSASAGKNRIFIVHRLDRDASGLIVFAKTEKAKEFLQKNWKRFEKKYVAIVQGTLKKPAGTIESYLTEDKFQRVYSTRKSGKSKFSVTHYRVLESWGKFSLLEISLETGRKNQIRVHLADMGHPIVGDEKYGSKLDPIRRLGLHAHQLKLEHPETGKPKTFTSPLPQTFSKKLLVQ